MMADTKVTGALPHNATATRGTLALLITQLLAKGMAFAFVATATRFVSPGQFGRFSIASSVVLIANFLADAGTSYAITRTVSREPQESDRLLGRTLLPSLLLGTILAAGAVGFSVLVQYPETVRLDVLIAVAGVPAWSAASSLLAALVGRGLIAKQALVSLAQAVLTTGGGLIGVVVSGDIRVAIICMAGSAWLALLLAALIVRRHRILESALRFDAGALLSLLRRALPFAAIAAISALNARYDVILLSIARGSADTAQYDLAQRLTEAFAFISAAVTVPAFYLLSAALGAGDLGAARRAYRNAVRALYVLGVPISILLAVFAGDVVELVFGLRYAAAALPLRILGAGQILQYVVALQVNVLNASDNLKAAVTLALGGGALGLIADSVLIPMFGIGGAAVSMIVLWSAALVLYEWYISRKVMQAGILLPSLPMVAGGVAVLVISMAWRQMPLLAVPCAAAIYLIVLLAGHEVGRSDWRAIMRALRA